MVIKHKIRLPGTSYNSGYAVRAEYLPHSNCPALRFGQLRIASERYSLRRSAMNILLILDKDAKTEISEDLRAKIIRTLAEKTPG